MASDAGMARAAFALLCGRDLNTVHHALRMLAKFPSAAVPSDAEEATRLADLAWAEHCARVDRRLAEEAAT